MTKIAVTGGNGYVGSRLVKMGCSRLDSDVRDIVKMDDEIRSVFPDVIIHTAGHTDVDWCENPDNKNAVDSVNFFGSINLFDIASKYNIPVIFISSDHIFSGGWWGSYVESSEDFKPKNYYGVSKLATEAAAKSFDNVRIVRTSMLFDGTRQSVRRHINTVLADKEVHLPFFMWRSFMHVGHFARSVADYAIRDISAMPKVLNISGSSNISWYRFIQAYVMQMRLDASAVHPRYRSTKFPGEAERPFRAGLSTLLSERLGLPQYNYLHGIQECLLNDH